MKKLLCVIPIIAQVILSNNVHASTSNDVVSFLNVMKEIFSVDYAPAEWKKYYFGYDLDSNYDHAVTVAETSPTVTQQQSNEIIENFIFAMKDYHSRVYFSSTELSTLPFAIKGTASNNYFITYIDRSKLPQSAYPFEVGDEILSFDEKPIAQVMFDLQAELPPVNPVIDRAWADLFFAYRAAPFGIFTPQGIAKVSVKAKESQQVETYEISWNHTSDGVLPHDGTLLKSHMSTIASNLMTESTDSNPWFLSAKKSFTPDLGEKVWSSIDSDFFYSYIYKNPEGKRIGYIRIASYGANGEYPNAVAEFSKLIARFNVSTDALIVDEVNNPGGSAFYVWKLLSMLASDKPIIPTRMKFMLTQADAENSEMVLSKLHDVKTDEDAKQAVNFPIYNGYTGVNGSIDGYTATDELVKYISAFENFIISEWNAGKQMTSATYFMGIDSIKPAEIHYSKPLLVLVNHLSGSGADFFPAILQDNKRATIMG